MLGWIAFAFVDQGIFVGIFVQLVVVVVVVGILGIEVAEGGEDGGAGNWGFSEGGGHGSE